MKFNQRIGVLVLGLGGLTGLALALPQSPTPAQPATPVVTNPNGGPIWRDNQDIGNGISMNTVTGFCKVVTDPATSASVRPVSLHVAFLYGVGLMTQVDYMELRGSTDTSTVNFLVTLDRNVVVATRPLSDALNYDISITPKAGFNWGTVRGAIDLEIVAVQMP